MSKVEINRERFYTGGPFNTGLTNLRVIHKDKKINMVKERNIAILRLLGLKLCLPLLVPKEKNVKDHKHCICCTSLVHLVKVKTMKNSSLGPRKR